MNKKCNEIPAAEIKFLHVFSFSCTENTRARLFREESKRVLHKPAYPGY